MAHSPEMKQRVRASYVHEGLGLDQAAQKLKISSRTTTRWRHEAFDAGDDWDKARAASMLAGEGAEVVSRVVLEEFLKLFQSTLDEITKEKLKPLAKAEAMSRLADAYTKTIRAIQKSAPELNRLAMASDVLQLLAKFVKDRFPAHAAAFMEVLEPFGEELVKTYG